MADLRAALALGLALLAAPAQAHLLKVFAFADGGRVEGSVYFSGGGRASDSRVTVRTPGGRVLATIDPDADGAFAFTAAERVDHVIAAATGEGHTAEWTIRADELAGAFPQSADHAAPSAGPAPGAAAPVPPPAAAQAMDLEKMVDRAVARQIRPLREALLAYEERVRLHDLLGGIGYIAGLAGLALWWGSRRTHGKP